VTAKLPHPLVLLLGCVVVAVALTWVVPAGAYQRRTDAATQRDVVVPGTYAHVAAAPVRLPAALIAVPQGMVAGADIIVLVLFVGGAFALLDATGALARLVGSLVGIARHPRLAVVGVSLLFATLGALENMHEEIIALIPVLLVLSRGLGFGAVTALSMSIGSAVVGSAFGPTNPFQTGIALRFAEMPALSQPALRFGLFAAAVAVWVGWTIFNLSRDDGRPAATVASGQASVRDGVLLALALVPFVPYVIGVLKFDWGFNELSGFFLIDGFVIGAVAGYSLSETAVKYLKAMEGMLGATIFIGVARAISVVLNEGRILDTILYSMAAPLAHVPGLVAALLMVPLHAALHVAVVSVSGQAVLTMPVMGPLSDLLGLSRDAAVIAYQTGAGLTDMLTPTNGALLAMLLGANVTFGRWMKFAIPGAFLVSLVGLAGILLAR